MANPPLNFDDLKHDLNPRLRDIVQDLLPNGKVQAGEYAAYNPKRHDRKLGSFKINLTTGKWSDFATDDRGGDIISLYAYIHNISQLDAARQLGDRYVCNPVRLSPPNAPKAPKAPNPAFIAQLWEESIPLAGMRGALYLTQRGLMTPFPKTIRFHPNLLHAPTGTYWPALISAVQRFPDDKVIAVHRTYLDKDCKSKAPISPNKMMLGSVSGGAVRLGEVKRTLIIAEGIETALSLRLATEQAAWAVLSASNFQSLVLPNHLAFSEIIIGADHDAAGLKAAYAAADLWTSQGKRVRVALPPKGQDFNDVLRGVS